MLDDEMYRAIGEVAVAAAQLEHQLAFLVAIARDEGDEWMQKTLGKPGEVRKQLDRLIEDVQLEPLRRQLLRLRRDAYAVLDDRHAVVHSVAMLDRGEDGDTFWTFWHPRSDTEARIDPHQLREHARDLGTVASRALQLSHDAAAWRTASGRPEEGEP